MIVECKNCGKEFDKKPTQIRKGPNHFCCRSCAATYNNKVNVKRQPLGKCKICKSKIKKSRLYCDECWPKINKDRVEEANEIELNTDRAFESHSKFKGTLAETRVISDLYLKGFSVSVPMDDLLPFDLIAISRELDLYKIQVKYCSCGQKDTVSVEVKNSMSNRNLTYSRRYTKKEVDVFAAYIYDIDTCVYIKSDILDEVVHSFNIRIKDSVKNGQRKGVRFYKDYLDFPY